MQDSITFEFNGKAADGSIRTLRDGDLDSSDLEAIAAFARRGDQDSTG